MNITKKRLYTAVTKLHTGKEGIGMRICSGGEYSPGCWRWGNTVALLICFCLLMAGCAQRQPVRLGFGG